MSIFEELGIAKEAEDVEAQKIVTGGPIDPGVYEARVERAYIRKTDSGARMVEIDFLVKVPNADEPRKFHNSICITSGDEKGNKPTFGVHDFKHFLQAVGDMKPQTKKATVDHFGTNTKALTLPGLSGKNLLLGLIHEENDYNNQITIRNAVRAYLDKSGKNADGEDLKEKLEESIEKAPMKKSKAKAKKEETVSGSDDTKGGW